MIEFNNGPKWATTISVASGKGGVGKTSFALKLAMVLANKKKKVLIIDCDYNLSNTLVKLGLPLNNNFYYFIKKEMSFNDCVYKKGNFHLLAGCNGNVDLFNQEIEIDRIVLKIVYEQAQNYDYIILDAPSGVDAKMLKINAYTDERIFILNPDASSITDSYSLIKMLHNKYGTDTHHVVFNRIPSIKHFSKISRVFSQTLNKYLNLTPTNLGYIEEYPNKLINFDEELLQHQDSKLSSFFTKVIENYTDKNLNPSVTGFHTNAT